MAIAGGSDAAEVIGVAGEDGFGGFPDGEAVFVEGELVQDEVAGEAAGGAAVRSARDVVVRLNARARLLEAEAPRSRSAEDVLARLLLDLEVGRPLPATAPGPSRHSDVSTVTVAGALRYRQGPLEDLLDRLPSAVFRAKGIVALDDGRWLRFQAVGGRVLVDLDVPAPEHGESRIVFFGPGVDREALRAALRTAEAAGPGRG